MAKTIVAVSGYFDPMHIGHIEYLEKASQLGDELVVIVNNDYQASLKKGKSFMPQEERMAIVRALRCVDRVLLSIDNDRTVCKSLEFLKPNIFAKGGDRTSGEIPEGEICRKLGIQIVDGLGGKIQSSSGLIAGASLNNQNSCATVQKPWGSYTDFTRESHFVSKELLVNPGCSLSEQYHDLREEHWLVVSGEGKALVGQNNVSLKQGKYIRILKGELHRIINDGVMPLRIFEVQLGECREDDIHRTKDEYGREGTNT